ncbi:hypothetical protein [Xenorhabdus khoisanae]|nr:hypothetical protein [Xenorhabdus khoisanae]
MPAIILSMVVQAGETHVSPADNSGIANPVWTTTNNQQKGKQV